MPQKWFESLENPKNILQGTGIWIDFKKAKPLDHVKFFVYLILNFNAFVMEIMYLIQSENLKIFTEAAATFPAVLGSVLKILNFIANKKEIEDCLQKLQELIECDQWIEKQNVSKLLKRVNRIDKTFKIILIFSFLTCAMSLLVPIFNHELPFTLWFPYDYEQNEILFWVSVAYEVVCFVLVPVYNALGTFPVYLISFMIGITEELSERLTMIEKKAGETPENKRKASDKRKEEEEKLQELLKCIEIHIKIKDLAADVSNIFGKVIWIEGLFSVLIICTASFASTVVRNKVLAQK